ncbi:MAG: nucleoside triphosphate pyrophosphohydrolase family protein [Clostridiales bacterium]|nr:nucleoside triphosphate pyrophosphohydrolase family protein [Clostridiales bacterium]
MDIQEYQNKATRTLKPNTLTSELEKEMCFGLVGETGEVIDILKKYLYQNHPLDKEHLKEELGDVCWYLCNLATITGIDMNDVLNNNIKKLMKRYPEGFSAERSINRNE